MSGFVRSACIQGGSPMLRDRGTRRDERVIGKVLELYPH